MSQAARETDGDASWEVLDRRMLFRTTRDIAVAVETVRLPDGSVVDDYYQIVVGDSASVFAETCDGRVVALRHYSHGARRFCIGLPAGRIGPDESPVEAARRELREETGYDAAEWKCLGSFVRNGNQGGGVDHLFLARNARPVADPASGDLEAMEVLLLSYPELRSALQDNEVCVLAHALGISMGLLEKGNRRTDEEAQCLSTELS